MDFLIRIVSIRDKLTININEIILKMQRIKCIMKHNNTITSKNINKCKEDNQHFNNKRLKSNKIAKCNPKDSKIYKGGDKNIYNHIIKRHIKYGINSELIEKINKTLLKTILSMREHEN